MKILDIGERELVQRIKTLCAKGAREDLIEGIGDDCAVYTPSSGFMQVVTIDALVENSHFSFKYFPPQLLGRKAISVNLSDIAAMGAVPKYALVSLQLPPSLSLDTIDALYRGMMEVALPHNLSIIGGNLTSSEFFSIHISMIGEVEPDRILSRNGSRVGNAIYVTGNLGSAAAGFEIASSGKTFSEYPHLKAAYLNPTARVKEGRLLAEANIPSAMMDVSDGIASDLRQIAFSSGIGALIEENLLPASNELRRYVSLSEKTILDYQLYGGEDYQLLFTVAGDNEEELKKIITQGLVEATRIGTMVEGESVAILRNDGSKESLPDSGFSHF